MVNSSRYGKRQSLSYGESQLYHRLPSLEAQICSLLFGGSSTISSKAHALQKTGRSLLALTQGALLSGRMVAPTLNNARESNIWSSTFLLFLKIWVKNPDPVRKTFFEKIDGKDLQLEQSHDELRLPLLSETESRLSSSLLWSF